MSPTQPGQHRARAVVPAAMAVADHSQHRIAWRGCAERFERRRHDVGPVEEFDQPYQRLSLGLPSGRELERGQVGRRHRQNVRQYVAETPESGLLGEGMPDCETNGRTQLRIADTQQWAREWQAAQDRPGHAIAFHFLEPLGGFRRPAEQHVGRAARSHQALAILRDGRGRRRRAAAVQIGAIHLHQSRIGAQHSGDHHARRRVV